MFLKLLLHLRGKKGITRGEIFLLKSSSLIIPFGHIHLLVHGQPSSSMFSLHLVSYIALKVAFFKKIDHKKRTFNMWQRSGPWCNQPLEHQASWLCLGKLVCHGWRASSKKKGHYYVKGPIYSNWTPPDWSDAHLIFWGTSMQKWTFKSVIKLHDVYLSLSQWKKFIWMPQSWGADHSILTSL